MAVVLSEINRAADPTVARQRRRCMSASSQPQSPGTSGQPDVTALLLAWGAGDRAALDVLVPVVYAALRAQAARALRQEADGHTLSTTALVHEAYLRLVDQSRVRVESRSHFYGIAARLMRQILVDHARARGAAKRGGLDGDAAHPVTLGDADAATGEPAAEVLAVHEALERLALLDPDRARLVELRYFAGLTIKETAATLGVSPATANREWVVASAWLRRELEDVRT
jgi:RNA polymerase sigma factor (TIGR02999 family)